MADILIPQWPEASYCDWIGVELILPNGYTHVASVQRADASGNSGPGSTGEIYDLGVKEGIYRLFRRGSGELEFSHVGNGEALSDADLIGFGLSRSDSPMCECDLDSGYSSLNRAPAVRKLMGMI